MADKQNYDVIFIGGGLASGIAAILLREHMPQLSLLIVEAREKPEIPQTWSFQSLPEYLDPSLTKAFSSISESWLNNLISCSWTGYEVRFPELRKQLQIPYHSLRSSDFWNYMRREFKDSLILNETVAEVQGQQIRLESGRYLQAKQLIDARGWAKDAFPVAGYQKFVGLNLTLKKPHHLSCPILMDATVRQEDGFRFMYTLPWDAQSLLIEDTHYSDHAKIDLAYYRSEIIQYAETQGWEIESIGEMEQGALALPSFSKSGFTAKRLGPTTTAIGVRAGLFHATTGYSLYDAVLGAEQLVESARRSLASIDSTLSGYCRRRWADQEFYRRLNNMLFLASEPSERYRVLERFYEHSDDLISRFYAGKTTRADKIRIISGKPSIPMKRAIYHFFNRSEVQHG
ncbi:MAG: lycopene beta-cyclase CrtY [Oligoflexus sp.]|nr:lycopene beta-cyclase CrtY [Oligoflexus sp.]